MEFIFMLTHDDRTVEDALGVYRTLGGTGLRFAGFKDVGCTPETIRRLTEEIHDDDRTAFLEVVSTSRDAELRSIEVALDAGVDYILGGTNIDDALALVDGTGVGYCPFPGTVVGHPSALEGTVEEIALHAATLTARAGVTGVDLLAYRHRSVDPAVLVKSVVEASHGPVIVAGSVDSEERIQAVAAAGAWAFTIGGAIFENRLSGSPSVAAQVRWALEVAQR